MSIGQASQEKVQCSERHAARKRDPAALANLPSSIPTGAAGSMVGHVQNIELSESLYRPSTSHGFGGCERWRIVTSLGPFFRHAWITPGFHPFSRMVRTMATTRWSISPSCAAMGRCLVPFGCAAAAVAQPRSSGRSEGRSSIAGALMVVGNVGYAAAIGMLALRSLRRGKA